VKIGHVKYLGVTAGVGLHFG